MKGKYSLLSESEIEKKVQQGIFKEDSKSRVIRDAQNKFVRFLDSPPQNLVSYNSHYNQYFQVVNNYITYTDTQKIIKEILDIKNQEVFLDLQESHRVCLNFLQQYQNSKNPKIIQKLNESALSAISKYQVKLIQYLRTDFNDIDKKNLLDTCESYIDLIKIYKFSSYLYHSNNTLDYHDVKNFLAEIFNPLQELFESLICEFVRKENNISIYNCSSSFYMKLFLDGKTSTLEQYSCMDSRFGSLASITSLISKCFSQRHDVYREQSGQKFDENFIESLYQILVSYDELDSFNEIFNPHEDTILIEERNLRDILLPSKKNNQ